MKKQQVIRCCSCGSSDVVNNGKGIGVCSHCGSSVILPRQDEEIISMLNAAYVYRENFNYDLAIKSYQFVLEKDSNELSAYEGLLLAEYGIEYVKDTYTGKLIPTCHRAHFKSILEDPYYQTLITLASEEQKVVIEQKAKEIDKLQKAIERQLKNEESYDVFISYKANDKNGEKTEDSLIARQIYEELSAKNYKVFFAEKSLEDRLGNEYEPIIFKALHTCKIFILVGTSKENVEANWVRNEWSRFVDRVKTDKDLPTGCFIPVFKDMNPYDMPKVSNTFVQGVDAGKLGYLVTITDGVTKLLKPQKEQKILQAFDNVENFAEFERIQKQRKKDVKKARWKDLQTNPHRKVEKWFYNTFLWSPYVLIAVIIGLLASPSCWFSTNVGFVFLAIFEILLLCVSVAIVCVHPRKYPTNAILHVMVPFLSFVAFAVSYTCCVLFYPLANDGRTAANMNVLESETYIADGLIYGKYEQSYGYEWHLIGSVGNNWYKKYTKEIDGDKYLILPDTFRGNAISRVEGFVFAGIEEGDVDIIVAPKYCNDLIIGGSHGWNNKYWHLNGIKAIYTYQTLTITICTFKDELPNLKLYYALDNYIPDCTINYSGEIYAPSGIKYINDYNNPGYRIQKAFEGYLK